MVRVSSTIVVLAVAAVLAVTLLAPTATAWEGSEHRDAGDTAWKNFIANFRDHYTVHTNKFAVVSNQLALSYGEICAVFGDFFNDLQETIGDGLDEAVSIRKFNKIFNNFISAKNPVVREWKDIEAVFGDEYKTAQAKAPNAHLAFSGADGDHWTQDYARITHKPPRPRTKPADRTTARFMKDVVLSSSRFMKLAKINYDHFVFGGQLQRAYLAMHKQACVEASKAASQTGFDQMRGLQRAFIMNAMADHFLSDNFAAGHLRTPRRALRDSCKLKDLGNLMSRFMHDEDNWGGLFVENNKNEKWQAFGDASYFDERNAANKARVEAALTNSLTEIGQCFVDKSVPANIGKDVLQLVPRRLDPEAVNRAPMFRFEMRRRRGNKPAKMELMVRYPFGQMGSKRAKRMSRKNCFALAKAGRAMSPLNLAVPWPIDVDDHDLDLVNPQNPPPEDNQEREDEQELEEVDILTNDPLNHPNNYGVVNSDQNLPHNGISDEEIKKDVTELENKHELEKDEEQLVEDFKNAKDDNPKNANQGQVNTPAKDNHAN